MWKEVCGKCECENDQSETTMVRGENCKASQNYRGEVSSDAAQHKKNNCKVGNCANLGFEKLA